VKVESIILEKTKWESRSQINLMLKDKIDKNKIQFVFKKKKTSEPESTNQALDVSHACHQIQ
jgi:hypothetical protein